MKIFIVLPALVAACAAFVCLPDACDNVEKPVLNCLGETIKGSGWCGCTDSCAKLEGEECSVSIMSIPNENQCGEGLVCKPVNLGGAFGKHVCVKDSIADTFVSKRIVCIDACENVNQEPLNCVGGVHSTDFCGCRKVCAKQKGESCTLQTGLSTLLGVPSTGAKCDEGLVCKDLNLEGHSTPTCVDPAEDTDDLLMSKRSAGLMVCPEDACVNLKKPVLNCKGGLIKNSGWCGCTDSCAKVRGERCISEDSIDLLMDVVNVDACDEGLVCHKAFEAHNSICLMPNETSTFVSKRSTCDTACRKKTLQCTFSFVIYEDQWFAKCDTEGNFLAEQCSRKGECFCVDEDGTIDESTRVLGSANCS